MAYATKWTLSFNSLRNVSYTVNILVDGFSGTAKRLRAAEKPFTIDENNSDDYFETIRTQSGYIRIINEDTDLDGNAFDYSELIATNAMSHQVQLLSGQTILWVGYIKPVVLTSTLFGYKNTIEIPIQCPLSVLGTINLKFDTTLGTFLTMGQIIYTFFSRINNITWENVYLTADIYPFNPVGGSSLPFPSLNAKVDMFNFSNNQDPTLSPGSTFTNYSAEWEDETPAAGVLEEICRFWGWTIYVRGVDIYIMANGQIHNYYQLPFNSLAYVLDTGSVITGDTPTDIASLEYMSNKHTEEYMQGRRKITIEADANSDELVLDPLLQDLTYQTNPSVVTYTKDNKRTKCFQSWLANPEQDKQLFLHNCRLLIQHPDFPTLQDPINIVMQYDQWEVGPTDDVADLQKMSVKNSFNLKQDIIVYCRSGSEPAEPTTLQELKDQTYMSITTLQDVVIPADSQLCLYSGASITLNPYTEYKTSPSDYVRMYLRIGNYWWGGILTGWTTTMCTFKVYLSEHNEILTTRAIYSATTLSALYPNAKGYVINNTGSTKSGILEVGFLNYPKYRSGGAQTLNYNFSDFRVNCFVKDYTPSPENKSKQEYEGVASNMFQNDMKVSLSMASGTKNLFGKGQLFLSNTDQERLDKLTYNGRTGSRNPEQQLLDNMCRVYGQTRHRMKIEVAESSADCNPLKRYTYNNKTYIMQSAKHEYEDDKMTLTLIEE